MMSEQKMMWLTSIIEAILDNKLYPDMPCTTMCAAMEYVGITDQQYEQIRGAILAGRNSGTN